MIAIPSLDQAEVPDTPTAQIRQAARWFVGPARALRYLRDPATQPGLRASVQAISALGSAGEWLGCAIVPPATLVAVWYGPAPVRVVALAVIAVYLRQLVLVEASLGALATLGRRLTRVLTCPAATVLFGLGGFIGAVRLVGGCSDIGKTERGRR